MTNEKMPVIFVAHGAPTLAMDPDKGEDYKRWGTFLLKPKAILVFSAHWETKQLAFGETMDHNQLVYDFSGFQPDLYRLQYRAPGAPWLMESVAKLVNERYQILLTDRGLDHGVWVPFLHIWPDADVPILQMSLPYTMPDRDLFILGTKLAPLRNDGILIVGSGGLTHNLSQMNRVNEDSPPTWVSEFDSWVERVLTKRDVDGLLNWETEAPYARQNHPTPEHFRPLFITSGAAQGDNVTFPITGFELTVFTRRSVQFG
jgi:4,5-DOPA dioxygenase extradiol